MTVHAELFIIDHDHGPKPVWGPATHFVGELLMFYPNLPTKLV